LLLSIIVLFVFSQNKILAQAEKDTKTESSAEIFTAKHAIYGELGGTSNGYAINYGLIFHQKGRLKYSASAGFFMRYRNEDVRISPGFLGTYFLDRDHCALGKSKGHLEFGTGFVAYRSKQFIFDEDFLEILESGNIGVRQLFRGLAIGIRSLMVVLFFFRAAYTPWIKFNNIEGDGEKVKFLPFGIGLSLGWSF